MLAEKIILMFFPQNNTYAIISSYSTSTDADPCTYTFCRFLIGIDN